MKFFFPDSQDLVDPSFDFEAESRAEFRVRMRDDLYAHEVFAPPPFSGILVSKAIVDGPGSAKYSLAQRHRLLRVGIRRFLRLDEVAGGAALETIGDCGAFSYKDMEEPPFTVEEVVQFYHDCEFDYGISVDHLILEFDPELDDLLPGFADIPEEFLRRQGLTLQYAELFMELHGSNRCSFTPLGVAQGWSPGSYAAAVESLQKMGYRYIAIGGMVPLRSREILATLERVNSVRHSDTRLHLLGVTRCEHVGLFTRYGVASFDSTSPFMQAFKDAKDNYHTLERKYMALRVPQVEGNSKLQRRITAGKVDQGKARRLEQQCLQALREYDRGTAPLENALDALLSYERVHGQGKDRTVPYRQMLESRAWKDCPCAVCRQIGVDVAIFRGTERNKRRGFHNLFVFQERLRREIAASSRSGLTAAL